MGKTTFAKKLSKKVGIPFFSTDDIFYIRKFTVKRSDEEILRLAKLTFAKKNWIVEGSTRRILSLGLKKADKIFYFQSTSLLRQYYLLFTRRNKHQDFKNLLSLTFYLFKKRFGIGEAKKVSYKELLKPYQEKVIVFANFTEIEYYLESFSKT